MLNKVVKYSFLGMLCGSFSCLIFSVLLSLKMGTGAFYFAIPALVNEYGNELISTVLQITTFLWLGFACGVAFAITENMEWSTQKQFVGYFVVVTIGLIPAAFMGHWFQHLFIGLFSYLLSLTAISLILFIIGWIKLNRDIVQIKRVIALEKENTNE